MRLRASIPVAFVVAAVVARAADRPEGRGFATRSVAVARPGKDGLAFGY
ncbi:MAG: hypothetical protein ACP5NF_06885 [Thermoanaerobaculum sp.]